MTCALELGKKNSIGIKYKKEHNSFLHVITRADLKFVTNKPPLRIGDTNISPLIMDTHLHRCTGVGVKVSCYMLLLKDIEEF